MKIYHPLQMSNLHSEPYRQDITVAVNTPFLFKFTYQDSILDTDDLYLLHKHKLNDVCSQYTYRYWFIEHSGTTFPLLTYSVLVLKIKNIDTNKEYTSTIDLEKLVNNSTDIKKALTRISIPLPKESFAGNWIYWFYGITRHFSIYNNRIYFNKECVVNSNKDYVLPEQAEYRHLFLYGSLLLKD